MRAVAKALFIGVGLVLIAVAVGLILLSTQADKLARAQLQRTLAQVLKTGVAIESTEVAVMDRTLKIRGLTIDNPAGFSSDAPAMHFDQIDVTFDAGSVLSETPVIEQVFISGVQVNLEFDAEEGTNIGILRKEAERTSLERRSEQPRNLRRQYEIRALRCENTRIDFATNLVPGSKVGLDVSPFTLENVSKEHPVTTSQVTSIFIRSVLREALTFKGLLRPVGEFLQRELNELMGE